MKTLLLDDADAALLHRLLRAAPDAQALALQQRLEAGGDRVIVQLGIEGGTVQGAFANCPADIMAVEWDESAVYDCAASVDGELVEALYGAWCNAAEDDDDLDADRGPLLDEFRELIGARRSPTPGRG